MNTRRFLPAAFIVISALFLIALNEFTELNVPPALSYILIIASMLTGVWLRKSRSPK